MTQKNFTSQVKTLLKGSAINSSTFWAALQQKSFQENTSYYASHIFENIINPRNKQFTVQNEQRMYSTLFALSYYKDRKPKNNQTIALCKRYMEKHKLGDAKWVLQLYISSHKDENFAQNFMNRIACMPKQIDWNTNIVLQIQKQSTQIQYYLRQKNSRINKYTNQYCLLKKMTFQPSLTLEPKILSPSYICFLDYIRGNMNEMKPIQYRHLIYVLKGLMHTAKSNIQGLHQLCAFIHLAINCLTFYSCTDQNIIKQLLQYANHFRKCWGIVGQMGQQLFHILYNQLKIPGYAFRKKLRRDFPKLDIKQSLFLKKQFYLVTQNQDCFTCHQNLSLLNLRKLIILHIIKICRLDSQQISQYIDMIRYISNDLTYQIYFKSLKIIDICIQFEVFQQIKKMIRQKMLQLLITMLKKFKIQYKNKHADPLQTQQFDSLIQDTNTYNIFKYPLYQITHINIKQFLNIKSKTNLYSIISKIRNLHSNLLFYSGRLSIIFYGTSLDFIQIVQILVRFITQADIQQYRMLQIYYLPKPQARYKYDISSYIASKDVWYNWFIYSIFKQRSIFPYTQLTKQSKNIFPSYLINKSIHMYIRQAKRILNINVYKCKLRIKDKQKQQIVYFTSHIVLGIFGQAQIIRMNKLKNQQKKQKYENISLLQIIKNKLQRYICHTVDVGFQCIDNINNTVNYRKQKDLKLADLQICSLPKQQFFGQMPDPTGNGLKLSLLSQINNKIFMKQILNKQNFRQNKTKVEMFNAFKDLFINYTIKSLSIKNNVHEYPFKVIIDGVVFDKVMGFQIDAPVSVNGLPITLPIHTFLPFK